MNYNLISSSDESTPTTVKECDDMSPELDSTMLESEYAIIKDAPSLSNIMQDDGMVTAEAAMDQPTAGVEDRPPTGVEEIISESQGQSVLSALQI